MREKLIAFTNSKYSIPFLSLLVFSVLAYNHTKFMNVDGLIQLFAGEEIFSGIGYVNQGSNFWPPVFAILIGLLSTFFSGFTAGKIISVIAAAGSVLLTYNIAYRLIKDRHLAMVAQLFVATNAFFVTFAIIVDHHMIDVFCMLLFIDLLTRAYENNKQQNLTFVLLGLLAGICMLIRTADVTLVCITLVSIWFFFKPGRALQHLGLFLVSFALIYGLWGYYTWATKGKAFNSWYSLYFVVMLDGATQQARDPMMQALHYKGSVLNLILDNLKVYGSIFYNNVISALKITILKAEALVFLLPIAAIRILKSDKLRVWLMLAVLTMGHIALVSLYSVVEEYLLTWSALMTITALHALKDFLQGKYLKYSMAILLALMVFQVHRTVKVRNHFFERYEPEVSGAASAVRFLRKHDADIEKKYVMSSHPQFAYYLNSRYIGYPTRYHGCDIAGAASLEGLGAVDRSFLIVRPGGMTAEQLLSLKADYVIYNRGMGISLGKKCDYLKKGFDSEEVSEIYRDHEIVIWSTRQLSS